MMRPFFGSLIGTAGALALLIVALHFFGPLPLSISQTTTNKQSTFDVSGDGEVTAVPDRANLSLGITANEATVAAAQDKGNRVINAITRDLKNLGIADTDIKTSNYSLYPNYNYQTGGQKITGYNLNATLSVEVKDFSKINQAIDMATQDGANQVGGINFTLSKDKQHQLETQVRQMAISSAKAKAESLSSLAGMRLGRIVNISENNNSPFPRPMMFADKGLGMAQSAGAPAVPTDVQPGSTTFNMTITLSYETL